MSQQCLAPLDATVTNSCRGLCSRVLDRKDVLIGPTTSEFLTNANANQRKKAVKVVGNEAGGVALQVVTLRKVKSSA